jgi:hypothetical protein
MGKPKQTMVAYLGRVEDDQVPLLKEEVPPRPGR